MRRAQRVFPLLALGSTLLLANCALRERRASEPIPVRPDDPTHAAVFDDAARERGRRILVSLEARWLWLLDGNDTLLAAPVAVGKEEPFTFRGKTFRFETPRGRRQIRGKETDPRWTPPDWHYYEIAAEQGLTPVHLKRGQKVRLSDGTIVTVRGKEVGRIFRSGKFSPWTPGREMIFDDKIFIPPIGSPQRQVPDALGTHKLDLGDGYLIHGTPERDSIGQPVSHGCIRLSNEVIARLYPLVEVGAPVFIY